MPFVPLSPEEQKRFKPPCRDREHHPPNMMVIRVPMKWKCPSCGQETMLYPTNYTCSIVNPSTQTWQEVGSIEQAVAIRPNKVIL